MIYVSQWPIFGCDMHGAERCVTWGVGWGVVVFELVPSGKKRLGGKFEL